MFAATRHRAAWVRDTAAEHYRLLRRCAIAPDDLVLDVGSGANPMLRANVLCEKFIEDGSERHGVAVLGDRPLVIGDVENLPFRDRAFDFVVCTHVLEHVADPERAVRELTRVAARGYIETPSREWERLVGFPFHRWMVSDEDGVLVFEPKSGPVQDPALSEWFANFTGELDIADRAWLARRRIGVYVTRLWEEQQPVEIRGRLEDRGFAGADLDAAVSEDAERGAGAQLLAALSGLLRRRSDRRIRSGIDHLLACPSCSSPLSVRAAGLRCDTCGADYERDAAGRPWLLGGKR